MNHKHFLIPTILSLMALGTCLSSCSSDSDDDEIAPKKQEKILEGISINNNSDYVIFTYDSIGRLINQTSNEIYGGPILNVNFA